MVIKIDNKQKIMIQSIMKLWNLSNKKIQPDTIPQIENNINFSMSVRQNTTRYKTQVFQQQQIKTINGDIINTNFKQTHFQQLPPLDQFGLKTEEIEKGEKALFQDPQLILQQLDGEQKSIRLVATNYKLCIFLQKNENLLIPYGKIGKISKQLQNQNFLKISIELKNGIKLKLKIKLSNHLWNKYYQQLQISISIKKISKFFAFIHYANNQQLQKQYNGWKLYQPLKQFQRMGIKFMKQSTDNQSDYKIINNTDGKFCQTYPQILVVPSRISQASLLGSRKFRVKQRIPALCFAYKYKTNQVSTLYRSSQCKSGFQKSRSSEDELLLQIIGNHKININNQHQNKIINCKIYDARGYYAALGNKISGKGYQLDQFYTNCNLQFLNIPNIHNVRNAYFKAIQAANGDDDKFYSTLEQSKWYQYIFLILTGSLDIANNLFKGINCLVHCSDGWDRTSQLCSLSALLLDPYYRTMDGLMILIEKDWIYFGHQFSKRLGHNLNQEMNSQRSQIFIQFLDCITQIMYQFPTQFQFTFKFIQDISQAAYTNLYGNFLCDSYLQLKKQQIKQKTISLWSKLKKYKTNYYNHYYQYHHLTSLLNLESNQKNMRFWKQHFLYQVNHFKDLYPIYSYKFSQSNLSQIYQQYINNPTPALDNGQEQHEYQKINSIQQQIILNNSQKKQNFIIS